MTQLCQIIGTRNTWSRKVKANPDLFQLETINNRLMIYHTEISPSQIKDFYKKDVKNNYKMLKNRKKSKATKG